MNFSQNDKAVPKNITGITIVVVLHIFIVYALVSGLAREVVEVIKKPVEATIVQEIKPPKPDTPPPKPATPPPKIKLPPPIFVPKPEVAVEMTPPPNAITAVPDVVPLPPQVSPSPSVSSDSKRPVHTMAVVDSSKCGKPPYPSVSLRNEEEGTVTLEFLIGVDGTVLDSKVLRSSGYQDLDKAARVGLSLCKFKPAFTDGKPEQSWTKMQYVWKLE